MSKQRRERLRQVVTPLVELDEFSVDDAKQRCSESSPGYVTQTIRQLAREGLLVELSAGDLTMYRWAIGDNRSEIDNWINRQIHGLQVTQTPLHERPRERLLRDGAVALSDADLLAILIRVGVRNESAVLAARKIANRFSTRLDDLASCSPADLKGISPAVTATSYAQIMAGIELGRRVARSESFSMAQSVRITSTKQAIDYCRNHFVRLAIDAVQEEFHIVTLDTKHKPIHSHRITVGTLDASLVHPREVFRPAIRDSASAILLVHNHPSGDPTPSREDHQVTSQLTEAGSLLGITVLDHIVVAKDCSASIRESEI